jgi:SAM-dependent methyltransferase
MPDQSETREKLFPATALPDSDWWQALWPEPLEVLGKVGLGKGMTAVDLCCGDGLFTAPMSSMLGGQVFAVDLDPENLVLAKHHVENSGAPPCTWITGDAMALDQLVQDKVDCVLIANTFHGVPDQTGLSKTVSAILKPGGTFIIINWHILPREETVVLGQPRGPRTDMRMSPEDVRKTVEPSGLSFEKIVELPPYHYGVVFRKP